MKSVSVSFKTMRETEKKISNLKLSNIQTECWFEIKNKKKRKIYNYFQTFQFYDHPIHFQVNKYQLHK